MRREELEYLLKKYNIKPRRENGQNFLISPEIVSNLIKTANINEKDIIIEIGSGLGALTAGLCEKANKVIAIEMDRNFIPVLKNIQKINKNLEIINKDVFQINFKKAVSENTYSRLQKGDFKIVANLPFNITSLVFRNFLEKGPRPSEMTVLIQKEVAERIVAEPGKHSLLSLSVQLFGKPKITKIVSNTNFYPKPKVDCAILNVKNIKKPENLANISNFFRILRISFASKRKKLANNLASGLKIDKKITEKGLIKLNLSINARAQELELKEWLKAFDYFKSFVI